MNSQQIGQLLSYRLEITAKAINHTAILFHTLAAFCHHCLSLLSRALGFELSRSSLFSPPQHCPFLYPLLSVLTLPSAVTFMSIR